MSKKPKKKKAKVKHQIVKASRKPNLRDKLDTIERETFEIAGAGFYQSRLCIEMSMWKKGKAIVVHYSEGVKCTGYRQMQKETGFDRRSLKKWHELYKKYSERKDYLPIAEEKAQAWTDKVIAKSIGRIESGEQGKLTGNGQTEQDVDNKKQVVMDSIDEVCKKLSYKLSKFGDLNTLGQLKVSAEEKDDYTGLLMLVDSQRIKQLRATLNRIFRLEKDRPGKGE